MAMTRRLTEAERAVIEGWIELARAAEGAPGEAVERWQAAERALARPGEPLPEEIRCFLFDVAHLALAIVDDTEIRAERAGQIMPEVMRLTGRAIGAYREKRRREGFAWLFDIEKRFLQPGCKVASVAQSVGETTAKRSTRTVLRHDQQRRQEQHKNPSS
jgi:hypothetical protein